MGKFAKGLNVHFKETNIVLLLFCIIASIFGVLMVHSSTRYHLSDGNLFYRDTLVMVIAIVLGLIFALVISFVDYRILLRYWPFIAFACIVLMASLFIWGVGPADRPDAKTWIPIGGVFFQPSELLKVGFVITFSVHLGMVENEINSFKNILLLGIHAFVPFALVLFTGDLGSALVFIFIFLSMLFISGVHLKYFATGITLCLVATPILWLKFLSSFQKERLLAVYYPAALSTDRYEAVIFQQRQAINAIGSGQLTGKGLFNGSYTQHGLVPVSENDMIFSVIGEELGFFGGIAALTLIFLIVYKIVKVARMSDENNTKLLCYGIATMIASQTILNIGMCLKLLPVIGITLPFFSAGGSSNLCVYIAIGIVLSVYRFNKARAPVDFRLSRIRTPFTG